MVSKAIRTLRIIVVFIHMRIKCKPINLNFMGRTNVTSIYITNTINIGVRYIYEPRLWEESSSNFLYLERMVQIRNF